MQAVYCLIGSVKKKFIVSLSTKYRWLVNLPLVGEKLRLLVELQITSAVVKVIISVA